MFSVHSRMITVLEHKLHFFPDPLGRLVLWFIMILPFCTCQGFMEEAGLYYGFCGPSQALPLQTPPL